MANLKELKKDVARSLATSEGAQMVMFQDVTENVLRVIEAFGQSNGDLAKTIEKLINSQPEMNVSIDASEIGKEIGAQLKGVMTKSDMPKVEKQKPVSYEAVIERDSRGNMSRVRLDPVT